MKIPYTIDKNIFKIYEPSPISLELVGDSKRTVKSEDKSWDENHLPKLSELCVFVIVANFEKLILLDELPCWDRDLLLEILPTDLPLEMVIKHIHDEIYWERTVKDRWKDNANYCRDYGYSWKKMYMERHVQEAIEAMTPEGFDLEIIESLCALAKNYVEVLNLRELQIMQPPVIVSEDEELGAVGEPTDHIDLGPIILGFENLRELHIQFGLRNVGSEYKKTWFQFSLQDCINLGEGISKAKNLQLLRIHNSNLDDDRLIKLLSNMEGNDSLVELDFSNCMIEDDGATAIARYMKHKLNLKSICLRNNKIGEEGISAIAFMITQENTCPLEKLDLKFNRFGDMGFKYLTSGLIRERAKIKILNVACCDLKEESGIFLGETLRRNFILTDVDISNNCLGEPGGRAVREALENNQMIQRIDLRMTEIADDDMENIYEALFFNRIRSCKGEAGVARELRLREKRAEDERIRLEMEALAELAAAAKAEEEAAKLAEAAAKAKEEED